MLYILNPGTYLQAVLKKKKRFRTIVFKLGKPEGSINPNEKEKKQY